MLDQIKSGQGKTEAPLVMSWALRRYLLARDDSLRDCRRMEEAWFNDSTLRHWLKAGDGKLLIDMFRALPVERFSGLKPGVAERWRDWKGRLYERAIFCLVPDSPVNLIPLLDEDIAGNPVDSGRLAAIVGCLESLLMPSRLELLQSIANRLPDFENKESARRVLNELLQPAFKLCPDALSTVLKAASFPPPGPKDRGWSTMAWFCAALMPIFFATPRA